MDTENTFDLASVGKRLQDELTPGGAMPPRMEELLLQLLETELENSGNRELAQ